MPNLEAEKALRQAIVRVQDAPSFEHACALMQNPEININAAGPESGKTALNFAVEKLFAPLISPPATLPVKEVVEFRLKIIDRLLALNAALIALQHPITSGLLAEVENRSLLIKRKITARISTFVAVSDFQLNNFVACLSDSEKLFIAAFNLYEEMVVMAKQIMPLETQHNSDLQAGRFATITNKVISVLESHDDAGAYNFVTKLKPKFIAAGYTTLCLEIPSDSTDYFKHYEKFLSRSPALAIVKDSEFIKETVFIDPRRDFYGKESMKLIIDTFANNFFVAGITMSLRDKGMFFNICQSALKHNGKIIVINGAAHTVIVGRLNEIKIPNAVIVPFVDPESVCLVADSAGGFVSKLPAEHKAALLFSGGFGATPLQLVDSKAESVDKALEDFAKLNLGWS